MFLLPILVATGIFMVKENLIFWQNKLTVFLCDKNTLLLNFDENVNYFL